MNLRYFSLCFLFSLLSQLATAQAVFNANAFRALSTSERLTNIKDQKKLWVDTAIFLAWYRPAMAAAQSENDKKVIWALQYEYFHLMRDRHAMDDNVGGLELGLLELAKKYGLKQEEIVAQHYVNFGKYRHDQVSPEHMYASILHEYEQMEALGFESFQSLGISRLLYHSGRFMFLLDDYEKALKILLTAEKYEEPTEQGFQVWIFIENHIQTIYQRQKNFDLGIPYAKKIIDVTKNCPGQTADQQLLCKTWLGIATIDIAAMYFGQGKYEAGERYANEGYELLKVPLESDKQLLRAEYDMLQVLIPIELELHKLDKAGGLLLRAATIAAILDQQEDPEYFKHVKFYQNYARYYELTGDYANAVRYANFAKPLQDSLDRRNDARTLEKIKQRIAAEKYTDQLNLVEKEKQLQTLLRNGALIIMLLMAALAFGNYKRLQLKRKQAQVELDAAKAELGTFTQHLREKSDLAENLRLELERLSNAGERSEYLEKLSRSTILTDDDWTQFRSIFEKVHPNFIATQKSNYPDLTQAELRYLALEKLQLTTHEMANMLGVSDGTIRQTKMRMKRKVSNA